ncbi:spindle assembly abnormal 4 [Aphomia sociella]
MDESYSESDVSLSPSQILERLQVLRQLQLLQRGKLQKQRLEYQEANENSSSRTEIVSHFSNSCSYNTFRSLLQTSQDISHEASPRAQTSDITPKVKEQDLLEGVSVLNLSEESEFIINSPTSTRSRTSASLREKDVTTLNRSSEDKLLLRKQISLDEMPILSPKKDFEALILEKLQRENNVLKVKNVKNDKLLAAPSKPFLKRGEGMARFGLNKKDLKIQNTKSLPWRQRILTEEKNVNKIVANSSIKTKNNKKEVSVQIVANKSKVISPNSNKVTLQVLNDEVENESKNMLPKCIKTNLQNNKQPLTTSVQSDINKKAMSLVEPGKTEIPKVLQLPRGKHPLQSNKGQTWASVLSKEQNDFLMQLKQSNYYKNFVSPAKSTFSDVSCEENVASQEKEKAEQNMFDLLESKVSHESFNLETSFFNKFLRKNKLEYSGESTPLIMQKCLANNPELMHISPDLNHDINGDSHINTCSSEYTECCSDACSSVSSCCSCKTIEPVNDTTINEKRIKKLEINKLNRKKVEQANNEKHQNDTATDTDIMKANIAEMNAKLITTSELLKDRLRELEDEIETFRKENAKLIKMRDEIDVEKQKFYEEKTSFEQKFNEEKILSEYYLAEEKEKLAKQKQMYDRYVREMRSKLNKKDKDEVQNLKKEINDLKEEIRLKDAKSTSTIARLRNQIKIMEKESKDLQAQVEKLKKENRRIQHSNEVTRRLTNIKYLEQINKKLSNMASKTQSEVNIDNNIKYKAFEIERQSRSRRVQPTANTNHRPRAKSVPNLNVTSRYAKYFSQRDAISQMDRNNTLNVEHMDYTSDNEDIYTNEPINLDDSGSTTDNRINDSEHENNLEKIYMERFQSISPNSNRSSLNNPRSDSNTDLERYRHNENTDKFFISKPNSSRETRSTNSQNVSPNLHSLNSSKTSRSISPVNSNNLSSSQRSINKNQYNGSEYASKNLGASSNSINRSKSPASSFSNPSSFSQNSVTVINKNQHREDLSVTPEPSTSRSSITKTKLNPTEIKKPDGSKELRFPNGNIKYMSSDGSYSKFVYYNGDVKENFYKEGRIKYFYAETKTFHTTHPDGLEVLEFPDGQVEKRYKDGSSEIRLPNGSIRYFDPKNEHVREEWRFPDGAALTVAANGEQRIVFGNGQVEVHAKDHKRREFPDGTVKLVYQDGTSETRYASGRVRIKDKHGNLIMDSASA